MPKTATPATRMGHIYSFHTCSENISFGSLDEIILVQTDLHVEEVVAWW
jgi:hypothetical protein